MLISVTNVIIYALLAIQFSMGHVIGGAFNTDFGDDGDEIQSSESEKAAATNNDRMLLSRIVRRAVITSSNSSKTTRTKAAKKASRKGKKNESLRARRDTLACALPSNLPQMVSELNGFLNSSSKFIGLVSQMEVSSPLPTNQPSKNDCPARSGSWWPRSEVNLRSTCPWIYEEKTLSSTYYPRKLLNAKCLCENCVTANSMTCESIMQNVTVFKVVSCSNGLAVMTKVEVPVAVGCHCANSATTESRVSSG